MLNNSNSQLFQANSIHLIGQALEVPESRNAAASTHMAPPPKSSRNHFTQSTSQSQAALQSPSPKKSLEHSQSKPSVKMTSISAQMQKYATRSQSN